MDAIGKVLAFAVFWSAISAIVAIGGLALRRRRGCNRKEPAAMPRLDQITVKRVTDHTSEEAREAVHLINGDPRIGKDERCDEADLLRWVRESAEMSRLKRLHFEDSLWVSIDQHTVVAAAFVTNYPIRRMAFLSYLVTLKAGRAGSNRPRVRLHDVATSQLIAEIGIYLRDKWLSCRHILTEIDDPREVPKGVARNQRLSRIRLFDSCSHISGSCFRVLLDTPYVQPVLDRGIAGNAPSMLLGVVDIFGDMHTHLISPRTARRMIRFIYDAVYGDSFVTQGGTDKEYRVYVRKLRQEAESRVRGPVRTPCGGDFVGKMRKTNRAALPVQG